MVQKNIFQIEPIQLGRPDRNVLDFVRSVAQDVSDRKAAFLDWESNHAFTRRFASKQYNSIQLSTGYYKDLVRTRHLGTFEQYI